MPMNQQEIDAMLKGNREWMKAQKRARRRAHPFQWFFGGLFCLVFFLFFAAILIAVYTHPMQP